MAATENQSNQRRMRATRSSLACAPCRYKHLRCDGKKPVCTRCSVVENECIYQASRRRGNPRPRQSYQSSITTIRERPPAPAFDDQRSFDLLSLAAFDPIHVNVSQNTSESTTIRLYYEFFHAAHPCALPRHFLNNYTKRREIHPLLLVMSYIGSLFTVSTSTEILRQGVQDYLVSLRRNPRVATGFDVQAILLYSIATYWCNEPDAGVDLLDETIRLALDLGLNRQDFAQKNCQDDCVLAESWRRTWWQIYVTDAHIAGSAHKFPFRTSHIEMTVDLPCEEIDYEQGNIPRSRCLQEYNNREFFPDDEIGFSSYAELIGLTRGIDQALFPGTTSNVQLYSSMCSNADRSVIAWHSLLPNSKRAILRPNGTVDEVMFKAKFIMDTYTVEIHRPMSSLAYSAIESVSHCAPRAPSDNFHCSNTDDRQLHTMICLAAIDRLEHLLMLPMNVTAHSPFIICMLANVIIAHLSACRFVFDGRKRAQCREKIRLTMGALKRLSDHWILGKRTYKELGIIARDILSLMNDRPTTPPEPPLDEVLGAATIDMNSIMLFPETNFDFCGFLDSS